MRTFILRLVRRGMITTRHAHLQPTANHKNRKVTLINVVNYDKFQYVDKEQSHTDRISQQILNNKLIEHTKLGSSNEGITYTGNQFGDYVEIETEGKLKWKHKFKENMPLKDKL